MSQSRELWEFWIDVGGTFTDCVARSPNGQLLRHKTLSSGVIKGTVAQVPDSVAIIDPRRQGDPARIWNGYRFQLVSSQGRVVDETTVQHFDAENATLNLQRPLRYRPAVGQTYELSCDADAPLICIRYLLGISLDEPLPTIRLRLGTTRGTNALLTRSGPSTALVVTKGFADVLHIGYQDRPHLFDLNIRKPPPLFQAVCEIDERINAQGEVLRAAEIQPNPFCACGIVGTRNPLTRDLSNSQLRQFRPRTACRGNCPRDGLPRDQRFE